MLIFNYIVYFLISVFSLIIFSIYAKKIKLLDKPNFRSSHSIPTPKSSGIVLCLLYTVLLYLFSEIEIYAILSISSLCFLGFVDDLFDIQPKFKLFLQFLCICLIYYTLNNLGLVNLFKNKIYNFIFLSMLILYFINIFNFMDGIDGISSLTSIFALSIILFLTLFVKIDFNLYNEILILIIILIAHFILNFTKFKSFLGDAGSLYLSCVLIIYLCMVTNNISFFLNIFLIIFSYYIFDTAATLLFRLHNNSNILKSHREHIYQRLNIYLGSHLKVNLIIILYNFFVVVPILLYYINNTHNLYIVLAPYLILTLLYFLFYDFIRKVN